MAAIYYCRYIYTIQFGAWYTQLLDTSHKAIMNSVNFCRNDYIFWMDTVYDRIYRSRTNGSNAMIIVNTGLSCAGISYMYCQLYNFYILLL